MQTEVIIAVRGELEQNILRTLDGIPAGVPVCIVLDGNEPENILPDAALRRDCLRLLRAGDHAGGPVGCGAARHDGIVSSEADLIVLADGHMDFPDGWLDEVQAYHRRRYNALTCCRMQSLDQRGSPLADPPQGGAFLALQTQEVAKQHWAISAKWNKPPAESGRVPAIMGACYAFRRRWYDKIGQPLGILRAWGQDEELLSLCTHLMGGHVALLPTVVGHIYMAQHRGRMMTADQSDRIWDNRHAVIEAMPMSDGLRLDLEQWMRRSPRVCRRPYVPHDGVIALKLYLARHAKRTVDDLVAAGTIRRLTDEEQAACLARSYEVQADDVKRYVPPPAPVDAKPQVVVRHDEVCQRCGSINAFRQIAGRINTGAFGIAYCRCVRCGHKAQVRYLAPAN